MDMRKSLRKLRKENNRLDGQIRDENQAVFTDIICYLRGSDLTEYDIEVVRFDLTAMVLEAQERGEGIDSLFGKCRDYREFCDDVIESLPHRTRLQKLCGFSGVILTTGAVALLIGIALSSSVFGRILRGRMPAATIDFSIGETISTVLLVAVAYIVVEWIVRNAFEEETKVERMLVFCAVIAVFAVSIMAPLFSLNVFWGIALVILMFCAGRLLEAIS